PYDHERVRPIPLYLHGIGVLHGRYHDLLQRALDILSVTDAGLLADACFDPAVLEELAVDPRSYDHGHPADKRPNYRFGEWDPHHIDAKGRYRRFVVRQLVPDALLARLAEEEAHGPRPAALLDELMYEAAAVLAGTILMASGISGSGPETHDSTATLSTLIPRVARCREAFYTWHLQRLTAKHRERLSQEATLTRQPFGGARQHINQYLARHRAAYLQHRSLALLLAEMGFPDASRRQAALIPVASVRLLSEMHLRLAAGRAHVERGELADAARLLPEVEDLLHRGIACGAIVDPWNILGFQGLFPLSAHAEDSTPDPRVAHLVHVIEQILNLYARVRSEAAAAGEKALDAPLAGRMKQLGTWWDKFATVEVHDVRRVHGGEALTSANQVTEALLRWRQRGEAAADLGFWRQHLEGFRSPKAFALVVDALLRKHDYKAAMALLMNWLGQAEQVPLEDGGHSFHTLALRWMLAVATPAENPSPQPPPLRGEGEQDNPSPQPPPRSGEGEQARQPFSSPPLLAGEGVGGRGSDPARRALIRKFLDYLEANADEYWHVPRLDIIGAAAEVETSDDEALYGAAYEDVTYRDSTDDDVEGEVLGGEPHEEFDLEAEGERLEKRLRFLSTVARLWNVASRGGVAGEEEDTLRGWLGRARKNYQGLLALMDAVHDHPIPEPSGAYDALVEFDRRRELKEQLLESAIAACLDTAFAVGALHGALDDASDVSGEGKGPPWEPLLLQLERALWQGDTETARRLVPPFIERFRREPLLFTPLSDGGHPRQVLRASLAQMILRALVANLPRLGLLRPTYDLLHTAWEMEQAQDELKGRRATEFPRLFRAGCQAVIEAVLDSAEHADPPLDEGQLIDVLEQVTEPFRTLWRQHSRKFSVSILEAVAAEPEWSAVRDFIKRYGNDLFHTRFMTLGNLRGVLRRGVGVYLDYLAENADPLHPIKLIEELDVDVLRRDAERRLQVIVQAIIENFEEFRDYKTTAAQSDYGENLHTLMDFLRLKVGYERHAWQLKPLTLVHEVLARRQSKAAAPWQAQVTRATSDLADQHLQLLARLEQSHGMHLRTVADRLHERFVKPLALDRVCAMIEPAMEEARRGRPGEAFTRLEQELESYAETTTGAGLDVPQWLRRLEGEVYRVQAARTAVAGLAENLLQVPRVITPLEDLRRQFEGL
ncbi:MAG TPA: hypothetical protein VEL76_40275, partial [Gemmataceae bacterium]|nr:hypothetical protein [Gemmataceae bacterium]